LIAIGIAITFGYASTNTPLHNPGFVTVAAGIITEFIAATFLVIYKSTMAQAQEYVRMLERINAVGMSLQVLNTLKTDNEELKAKAHFDLTLEILRAFSDKSGQRT
jgi:hypothetical protein